MLRVQQKHWLIPLVAPIHPYYEGTEVRSGQCMDQGEGILGRCGSSSGGRIVPSSRPISLF